MNTGSRLNTREKGTMEWKAKDTYVEAKVLMYLKNCGNRDT